MGDFSSLFVLAWTGLYEGLTDLVCMFVSTSCFENHLDCSGCFAAFLAKLSESVILLTIDNELVINLRRRTLFKVSNMF